MFPYMIALLISLFAGQWSHLCLVLFFSQRSTSEKRLMQSSNKRGRTMCWCSSEELLHRSEECLYRGFWSRTRVCMIVAMHGCAVYTLSLLILWISTHSRKHTRAHNLRGIPIFFFLFGSRRTQNFMQTCSNSLAHTQTHTCPHLFQLCTLVAFPAVYQTNVWVVFSSTGLNILFHFPLPHCLTHKYMPHTHTETHTIILLTHQEGLCSPQ